MLWGKGGRSSVTWWCCWGGRGELGAAAAAFKRRNTEDTEVAQRSQRKREGRNDRKLEIDQAGRPRHPLISSRPMSSRVPSVHAAPAFNYLRESSATIPLFLCVLCATSEASVFLFDLAGASRLLY